MDKWEVYSYLKRNDGQVNEDFADKFMKLSPREIQAGINEYEEIQKKNAEYFNPIDWGVTHG